MTAPILLLSQKQLQLKTVDVDSITTADDTFTTLYPVTHETTPPSARRQILNGSGSGGGCLLADATTFSLYDDFEIFNNSSEVQIIKNSDLTLFEFLVPRATAIVKCTSISTAAGAWEYVDNAESLGMSVSSRTFDDWTEHDSGINRKMTAVAFNGGSAGVYGSSEPSACGGVGYSQTGTSAANGSGMHVTNRSFHTVGNGAILVQSRIRLTTLGTNPEEFVAWVSLSNSISTTTGSSPVNKIRIANNITTGNWKAANFISGTEYTGTVGTNVAVSTSEYSEMSIVVSSDGTRCLFYVGSVLIATIATNVPTGNLFYIRGIEGIGTGTTDRAIYEDYHLIHQNLTTKR